VTSPGECWAWKAGTVGKKGEAEADLDMARLKVRMMPGEKWR
jgi:hypothetical protein